MGSTAAMAIAFCCALRRVWHFSGGLSGVANSVHAAVTFTVQCKVSRVTCPFFEAVIVPQKTLECNSNLGRVRRQTAYKKCRSLGTNCTKSSHRIWNSTTMVWRWLFSVLNTFSTRRQVQESEKWRLRCAVLLLPWLMAGVPPVSCCFVGSI